MKIDTASLGNSIFVASLWMGGMDPVGNLKLAAKTYSIELDSMETTSIFNPSQSSEALNNVVVFPNPFLSTTED